TSEYYSHIVEYLNQLHLDQPSEDQDQSSFTLIKRYNTSFYEQFKWLLWR
ncbi:unnamed protein product, partial [Brachionus calyciflorus]